MANYQTTKRNAQIQQGIIQLLSTGAKTVSELERAIELPSTKAVLRNMLADEDVECIDNLYFLPKDNPDDALDNWLTNWKRLLTVHTPGQRLCNAETNGIGGYDMIR